MFLEHVNNITCQQNPHNQQTPMRMLNIRTSGGLCNGTEDLSYDQSMTKLYHG